MTGSSNQVEAAQPHIFDFGDSPIPGGWKDRISQKMSEVFALHDLDFGRTDKVMHRIRLHDETPFKQRARPIHPQDFFFVVINIFFFLHITQHSIQNITKQNNRHILNISKSSQTGGREGRTTKTQKSQSRISNKKHCQASMVEGLAPPTRAIVHSQVTICRRLRIQYVFPHMCGINQFCIIVFFAAVKPANNILFCIELIQRPESLLRRHKPRLTDQSIRSKDDKTRFTCVHRLMTIGHSQNI